MRCGTNQGLETIKLKYLSLEPHPLFGLQLAYTALPFVLT
jgi:hypothetical protein